MIDSIQESFEKQASEQGVTIGSSEDRYLLLSFTWELTVENDLFWRILYYSYGMYHVYNYETLIRIYIRFQRIPHKIIDIYDIYLDYFDKKKGTLTSKGFKKLIKTC